MQLVYVKDAVLDIYEDHPEDFFVHPESGAVSYSHQWSVGYCHRVGRDVIALEIRKLYESRDFDRIQHWHRHAVPMPAGASRKDPNVATRAKRIVMAQIALGEALTELCDATGLAAPPGKDFIGLDGDALKRGGWYDHDLVRPITRHIPLEMSASAFRDRCEDLAKFVIEGLSESRLRDIVTSWGDDPATIGDFGSLKLLDRILQLVLVANETGLDITIAHTEIRKRYASRLATMGKGAHLPTPISALFMLYDVRLGAAHRGERNILKVLGVQKAHVAGGWGEQLDKLYDLVGEALEDAAEILRQYAVASGV